MFARTSPPKTPSSNAPPLGGQSSGSQVPQSSRLPPMAPAEDELRSNARVHPVVASIVGADMILEGSLAGDVELVVEGAVRGDIHVTRLLIGEKGHVEGRIRAQYVEVRGRVFGDIEGQKVKLAESAYVQGDILHEQLSIEPGAFFQGVCRQPRMAAPSASRVEQAPQPPLPWEKAS